MIEGKKLIFVVDDDAIFREALVKYLAGLGFDVVALEDGTDVLIKCQEMHPDLIVSDIRMPKLDGITLLKGLKNREETKGIPVVFMSAYTVGEIMDEAMQLGAQHFLFKPFPLDDLEVTLNKILNV